MNDRVSGTEAESDELVARLRLENAELRARVAGFAGPTRRPTRSWGWTVLATALVVIGSLLAPVGIVANWAKRELSDTDAFVTTFSSLAHDPAVQKFIAAETVSAIEQQADIPGLTASMFDGIGQLPLGPKAKTAVKALQAPATKGLENLVSTGVNRFVASKRFATLWRQLLQTGHVQLIATMTNDRRAVVAVGSGGAIGVQLGPVIDEVKTVLVKDGLTFAAKIPSVNKTIVIMTSDAALKAQRGYALVIALGTWLPWLALAFLIAGVLVARRRTVALLLSALALGASMLLTLAAIGVGRTLVVQQLSPDLMPADAARSIYSAVVAFLASSALAVAVLAFAVALVGWFAGPFDVPRRLRLAFGSLADSIRGSADRHGFTTGSVGRFLYRQRLLIRGVVAIAAAVLILLVRPLSPGLIVWTLVVALILIALLELLQRPGSALASSGAGRDGGEDLAAV